MIERVYPVRSQALVEEARQSYAEKIEGNKEKGLRALVSGDFKPFRGFPLSLLENTFSFSLILNGESQRAIAERVIQPLVELGDSYEIPMIVAGKGDHTPHVSVDAFKLDELPDADRNLLESTVSSTASHALPLKEILAGLKFHFNTLVVGPNIYICEGNFNDEQGAPYRARQVIRKIMDREKANFPEVKPLYPRYDDLFHSSVARIISGNPIPEEFIAEVNATIGEDIKKNPIPIRSDELFIGRWIDFHKRFPTLVSEG